MLRTALGLVLFLALPATVAPLSAATLLVLPDGTGDYPHIQAAIDAARDGDVILLGYGRFRGEGNRDLHYDGKAITIRSQSGHPETCVIDCEGGSDNITRGFYFDGEGPGSILQDVSIENGFVDDADLPFNDCSGGGAILLNGASPTFRNVTFRHCAAFAAGGVMILSGSPRFERCSFIDNASCGGGGGYCFEGAPEFVDCLFEENVPLQSGGGFTINGAESALFTGCVFRNNRCLHCGLGGGLALLRTTAIVTGCTFVGNRTYEPGEGREGGSRNCSGWDFEGGRSRDCDGGAIGISDADVTIYGCTIVGNAAPGGGGIGLDTWSYETSSVTITNSIIAFSTEGGAFGCAQPAGLVSIDCTDIYGNAGGDWTGCIAGMESLHHNLSADPLFCDLPAGDFTISSESPCAQQQSGGCWLIAAWPVGCGVAGGLAAGSTAGARGSLRVAPHPARAGCRVEICLGPRGRDGDGAATSGAAGGPWLAQVLDVSGRVVRDLGVASPSSREGCRSAIWDGRDNAGRDLPGGVYLVRSHTGAGPLATRLVLRP